MRLRFESVAAGVILSVDLDERADCVLRGKLVDGYPRVLDLAPGEATLVVHDLLALGTREEPPKYIGPHPEDGAPVYLERTVQVEEQRRQVYAVRRMADDSAGDEGLRLAPLTLGPVAHALLGAKWETYYPPRAALLPAFGRRPRRSQAQRVLAPPGGTS